MGKKRLTMTDEIRRAIDDSGMSRYAICMAAKIDQATMSRFMAGKVGMELTTLDRLADVLGLHVVVDPAQARTIQSGKPGRPRKGKGK